MKIVNKGFRKFSVKVGGASKDLLPLSEIEIDKEEGLLLAKSFPSELVFVDDEIVLEPEIEIYQEESVNEIEQPKRGRKKK